MKCFLTGGSGFLGSHIAECLLAQGWQVRAMIRSPHRRRWLEGLPVQFHPATFADRAALSAGVSGLDVVIHAAGLTRGSSTRAYFDVNCGSTETLLKACLAAAAPPKRIVFISSLAAAGPSRTGKKEDAPAQPVGAYGRSKRAAEKILQHKAGPLSWVILRPGPIYGPRDRDLLEVLRTARWAIRATPCPHCRYTYAHVEDVARAAFLAATRAAADRQVFHIGGPEHHTGAQAARLFGRAVGRPGIVVSVPGPLIWAAATIAEMTAQLTGGAPALSWDKAQILTAGSWAIDPYKSRRVLGYCGRWKLEDGLRHTVNWYRSRGWL
jgi:nucleoside-diphosphate-sugar epimerase